MDIHTQIPLKNLTTMRLGGPARFFAEAHTPAEVQSVYKVAAEKNIPVFVLGGGSNVIARDEGYNGLILRIKIPGFEVIADDLHTTTIKIGGGEVWDSVAQRTVEMRLHGIEAMSGIPGSAGAAPVQNVGAYGQDISETLVSLEAYDTATDTFVTLQNEDCGFSYRTSMFRESSMGRYVITSITLKLSKSLPAAPFYESLQAYFDENNITVFTHQSVRDGVLAIRKEKLPDPTERPNTGSFFKNAIIEDWHLNELRTQFPDIKSYDMGNGTAKIPTGWLIEKAGFKGQLLHGMRVNDTQALVLINESAEHYADLAQAREEITNKIRDTFRISIEQEPLEIPFA